MKKIVVVFLLCLMAGVLYAQDYKNMPIQVVEPKNMKTVHDAGNIKLLTTHELHNKEYDMYAEILHVKKGNQIFRFNQAPGFSRIIEIKEVKFFKIDEKRSVFFCMLVDTVAGMPVSPVFYYERPVLIVVAEEVSMIDFGLSLGGEEKIIDKTEVIEVVNMWEQAIVVEFHKTGSKEIISKVLFMGDGGLIWDERLSGGWETENKVTDNLNIRDYPVTSGKKISLIPKGATVRTFEATREGDFVDGVRDRWFRVTYKGTTGWIFGGYLRH